VVKKIKINTILKDLVQHIKDESPILPSDREKYSYDRGKWISQFGYSGNTHNHHLKDRDRQEDNYWTSIEDLRVLIYQIHFFGHSIHTNEDGRDVMTNDLIKEKNKFEEKTYYEKPN